MTWKIKFIASFTPSVNRSVYISVGITNRQSVSVTEGIRGDREGQPSTIDARAPRGFTRDAPRVSTPLNDAKYFVSFPRRLIARFPSSPTREGDVNGNPRYPAIDRNPRHVASSRSIDRSIDVAFSTRAVVVAYLLDVVEGGDSLGLDSLLRDGRLGDDADAGEGGSEGRHDFRCGRACCDDALVRPRSEAKTDFDEKRGG